MPWNWRWPWDRSYPVQPGNPNYPNPPGYGPNAGGVPPQTVYTGQPTPGIRPGGGLDDSNYAPGQPVPPGIVRPAGGPWLFILLAVLAVVIILAIIVGEFWW